MTRGVGTVRFVQDLLPDWAAIALGILTQLGDPWFLVLSLLVLYWWFPAIRRDTVLVGATYLTGVGLYRSIKVLTAVPRPDRPLLEPASVPELLRPVYEATAFSSGYGFPSGHATGSTIVFFGLAAVLPVGSRRQRYAVAAVLVALIGFTRIGLGLHFLVDVLAGFVLGGAVLLFAFAGSGSDSSSAGPGSTSSDRLARMVVAAVGTTVFYVAVSGAEIEAALSAGVALGLFGGWYLDLLPGTQ